MSNFRRLYTPVVDAYRTYSTSLLQFAEYAQCSFGIAAFGSARKTSAMTRELSASWARRGWHTITGGGPNQMHEAALGAYEERVAMIIEKLHELFTTLPLFGNVQLPVESFNSAIVMSLGLFDATQDEIRELTLAERTGRFVATVRNSLRAEISQIGDMGSVEAFDLATGSWEPQLQSFVRELPLIFSCSLYFPLEPPNPFADEVFAAVDFPSRLRFFEALSSAFVVLPLGGIGTLLELMLAVQWVQLLHDERNLKENPLMLPINRAIQNGYRPPIIVTSRSMWRRLRELLTELAQQGTINNEDVELLQLGETVDEVNKILDAAYREWLKYVSCATIPPSRSELDGKVSMIEAVTLPPDTPEQSILPTEPEAGDAAG